MGAPKRPGMFETKWHLYCGTQALAGRREHAALVAEGLAEAAASAALMAPVAQRKLLKEAEQVRLSTCSPSSVCSVVPFC